MIKFYDVVTFPKNNEFNTRHKEGKFSKINSMQMGYVILFIIINFLKEPKGICFYLKITLFGNERRHHG